MRRLDLAYNRLLGFDRIFMFYRPEVTQLPRWNELVQLPFVALTEQTSGTRQNYYNQAKTETMCLHNERFAARYDWVLTADIDEYLWFPEHIGVKEFLQRHENATYLSFGKQMHSLSNRVDVSMTNYKLDTSKDSTHFAVSNYPFYMKYFCARRGRKNHPICPKYWGRAKVMIRPQRHVDQTIAVHGTIDYSALNNITTIHFHPDVAHFKEWPELFAPHNVTKRAPTDFVVTSQEQVSIHNMHTGFTPIGGDGGRFLVWNGQWPVHYDEHLKEWFDFVAGRGSGGGVSVPETSRHAALG
jgi:Glycosyltransferase family 92